MTPESPPTQSDFAWDRPVTDTTWGQRPLNFGGRGYRCGIHGSSGPQHRLGPCPACANDHRGRASGPATIVGPDDPWPVAVSDGVGMPCSDCRQTPYFDYNVTDEFWALHVPDNPARLSVVCLPCLNRRCNGVGLAEAITEIQWTGTLHTVVFQPVARYEFAERT